MPAPPLRCRGDHRPRGSRPSGPGWHRRRGPRYVTIYWRDRSAHCSQGVLMTEILRETGETRGRVGLSINGPDPKYRVDATEPFHGDLLNLLARNECDDTLIA